MTNPTQPQAPTSLLSSKVYDRLKTTAQLLLPAVAALYFGLGNIWGFPAVEQVSGSVAILNVFVGVAVTWLKSLHDSSGAGYDGTFSFEVTDDGDRNLRLTNIDVHALDTKDVLTFKLNQ